MKGGDRSVLRDPSREFQGPRQGTRYMAGEA